MPCLRCRDQLSTARALLLLGRPASRGLSGNRCCPLSRRAGTSEEGNGNGNGSCPAAGGPLDLLQPHPGCAEPTCPPTFILLIFLTGIRTIPEDAMATGLAGMAAGGEAAAPVRGLRALGVILSAAAVPGGCRMVSRLSQLGARLGRRWCWGCLGCHPMPALLAQAPAGCGGLGAHPEVPLACMGQWHGEYWYPKPLSRQRGSFCPTVPSSWAGQREAEVTQKRVAEMSCASLGHSGDISPQTSCRAAPIPLLRLSEVIIRAWPSPEEEGAAFGCLLGP